MDLGRSWGRPAVHLLMAVLCLTAFLASSPLVHEALHHDLASPQHECLLTLFSKQGLLPATGPSICLVAVFAGLIFRPGPDRVVIARRQHRSAPSRGPPADSVSDMVAG